MYMQFAQAAYGWHTNHSGNYLERAGELLGTDSICTAEAVQNTIAWWTDECNPTSLFAQGVNGMGSSALFNFVVSFMPQPCFEDVKWEAVRKLTKKYPFWQLCPSAYDMYMDSLDELDMLRDFYKEETQSITACAHDFLHGYGMQVNHGAMMDRVGVRTYSEYVSLLTAIDFMWVPAMPLPETNQQDVERFVSVMKLLFDGQYTKAQQVCGNEQIIRELARDYVSPSDRAFLFRGLNVTHPIRNREALAKLAVLAIAQPYSSAVRCWDKVGVL